VTQAPSVTTAEAAAVTPAAGPQPEPTARTPACTPEELAAIVASDPRTAGAVIVTAPMPPRLIERSYATPSLIAHIASDKFCDGLPLHRQEDRFARIGVPIDRGTMCRWLEEAGGKVGATIVEAMRKEALGSAHCIATDATGVRVQPEPREDKQSQPCRRAHFFVQIADADHVFFEFTPEETSEVVDRMFGGYTGFVQADAKSVFDVLFRVVEDRPRPLVEQEPSRKTACTEVGCWSHARTKFWEAAVATQDVVAREALARIMRMFRLDAMWKNRLPDVRKDLRDRYLREHVTSFFAFVEEAWEDAQHRRGMLRSALGYCRNQKAALMRFLDDGALEMTNNRSERQLRRVATGRQAWLFVGSDLHGVTSGYLLTLIASARLHRLDPEVYLRDVFRVLPHWPRDRYLELAPRYWRITRARLRADELEQEVGWLTIPEPPLPTMPAINQIVDSTAAARPVVAP
jgi:transposase